MRTRRLLAVSAAALLALTTLAACGDDDDSGSSSAATTSAPATSSAPADTAAADVECVDNAKQPSASEDFGSAPEISKPEGAPPCELEIIDLEPGEGKAVQDISTPHLWNYEGVSWSTGEVFDSSFERGEPVEFSLDQVIPGWTNGLQGIKPGGRRMLIIPAEDAYGAAGRPGIAPNETLVFVVDLQES